MTNELEKMVLKMRKEFSSTKGGEEEYEEYMMDIWRKCLELREEYVDIDIAIEVLCEAYRDKINKDNLIKELEKDPLGRIYMTITGLKKNAFTKGESE